MHNKGRCNFQQGQGLLEVLVALAIAMVVLTALAVAAVTSVKNAVFSKNLSQATAYAKQAMDDIRAYRDANTASFFSAISSAACYTIDATNPIAPGSLHSRAGNPPCTNPSSDGDAITNTPFTRTIYLVPNDAQQCPTISGLTGTTCVSATINVYWTDSGGQHSAQQTSIFGKWQ